MLENNPLHKKSRVLTFRSLYFHLSAFVYFRLFDRSKLPASELRSHTGSLLAAMGLTNATIPGLLVFSGNFQKEEEGYLYVPNA